MLRLVFSNWIARKRRLLKLYYSGSKPGSDRIPRVWRSRFTDEMASRAAFGPRAVVWRLLAYNIEQGWPTRCSRAACGFVPCFMRLLR